ncbi:Glucan synthesis regulatory protein [Colletotrichum sidae]|uniref:Glucan synthesis regulatory protein n=2 Tax=Colletotrichum orbiculare species complex TaxID=2707354 RepID=A0A4R8PLC1_9PEZI|nr:Glucan synthesis regulatory protein [Colletotrichum spinosum]TEA22370.1 Glucan synthesis regulatory protein [Colletotrichum sidae]
MASSIGAAFRSLWHDLTSYDRHSTIDSPHRTGRHVPLNRQSGILTSVATASESRADVSTYPDESYNRLTRDSSYHGGGIPNTPTSPNPAATPYSPGLRSQSARRSSQADGFEMQSPGDVPMQSFQDGAPPAPPVAHSWKKIDAWAEEHYPELFDQLCEGCTDNDLNELEHQLDCSLPLDVRESLMVHDGQERLGLPTGIIFGSMLLDCEEIVQEWDQWRKVNQEFLSEAAIQKPAMPSKTHGSNGQASSSKTPASPAAPNTSWRQDLIARQDCVPPNAVQRSYAHPAWIPLVRDWGGNNLAVDLAPGPNGRWGQIVLFGRDYDTKYVIARSWSHFIAMVADDLGSGKWFVDEETNELKLREFKETRVEPPYFGILRWRMDQKYGRRAAKRKSVVVPPNRAGSPVGSGANSPYTSSPPSAEPNGETRGRSMQRLGGTSPIASPIRPGYAKSSPLARVAEETPLPELQTNGLKQPTKLVEVETPRPSEDTPKGSRVSLLSHVEAAEGEGKENENPATKTNGKANGKQPEVSEEPMKEIEI